MPMQQETVIFNRQVIRLCKGILKAWEQWVDEIEYIKEQKQHDVETKDLEPQIVRKKEGEPNGQIMNP